MANEISATDRIDAEYPNISVAAREGAERCWHIAESMVGQPPSSFVLCNHYVGEKPSRKDEWGSAWFLFDGGFVMEFYDFLSNKSCDLVRVCDTGRIQWSYTAFDPESATATDDSELRISGNMNGGVTSFDLTGVGANCLVILAFVRDWLAQLSPR